MGYGEEKKLVNKHFKKLRAGQILFVIGFFAFAGMIGIFVVRYAFGVNSNALGFMIPVFAYCWLFFVGISFFCNRSYRKNCLSPSASSTVLYVFQIILLFPFIIGVFILLIYILLHGGGSASEEKPRVIKIKYGNKEYLLTLYDATYGEYIDQYGDIWATYDNGCTFVLRDKRSSEPISITDDEGNDMELKPSHFDYYGRKDYEDNSGNLWSTWDGTNYEMTERMSPISITDSFGYEYTLRPTFRGSHRFLDQHGDEWWTLDDGRTYERVPKK